MLPNPPIDLSQVPAYIQSGGFLLALITLLLQIPQIAALTNGWKIAGGLTLVSIVGWATLFLGTKLTPDVLAQLQPYWAQFLVGLGAIAAYFGIKFGLQTLGKGFRAVGKVVSVWINDRALLRRLAIDERQTTLRERAARAG